MKLKNIAQCIALTALISTVINAREFRTPIPLLRYWLHTEPLVPSEECSQFYAWAGYYQRKCDTARCTTDVAGSSTTEKCPLSQLIFNQEDFTVNDIFATQNQSPINILFSTELSPRFNYTDRGAVIGFVTSHAVRSNVVVGGRVSIPFRNFNMKLTQGPIVNNQINQEILDANVREQVQIIDGVPDSYAYRLDFLSQLPAGWSGEAANFKLVDYFNTEFTNLPITIGKQDVTDYDGNGMPKSGLDIINRNPVTVIKTTATGAPTPPFAIPLADAQSLQALPSDGKGVALDERRRFVTGTNYTDLGNDPVQQSMYWVVPSFVTTGTSSNLVTPACIIQKDFVDPLINSPETAIDAFFEETGINFNSQKHSGLGDIDAQFFTQYWWNDCSFIEGNVALRLPTAGAQVAPGQLLLQSLGNNGHPEIMFGARSFWHDYDWLLLQADVLYSVVLKRTENVAIPYQGATVKNIGSGIPAHVNWQYFLCHAEASVYHSLSERDHAILRFGYEGYVKTKDSISLLTGAGCSCVPTPTRLNSNNLETNTHVTAHKLYGEACLRREFDCVTAGLFASVGGVVGGRNTPQDTDWYIGLEFFI